MALKDKFEKWHLNAHGGVFSPEVKEKFMKELKSDITKALDQSKKDFNEYLEEKQSKMDDLVKRHIKEYMEQNK